MFKAIVNYHLLLLLDCAVTTEYNFIEQIIMALVNMCSVLDLNIKETLIIVHAVIFGETEDDPLLNKLQPQDIFQDSTKNIK